VEEEVAMLWPLSKHWPDVNIRVAISVRVGVVHDIVVPPVGNVVDATNQFAEDLRPLVRPTRMPWKRAARPMNTQA
jgi:hypothetical protein